VLKLTLETNCIVALDEDRQPEAGCLRSLLQMHAAGVTQLRIAGSSASERQTGLTYLANFSKFRARLEALGLDHLERLNLPSPGT
jgi:hypothetical protein